jgi:HTH-type transcriptional regulator/antitoxin HigA
MRTIMDIRPIRTDKDHRAALAEIERLWGARTGTADGDKLDILVTLVERYEERRWPIKVSERFDPVDVLRYAIDELGHTQAELGELLGSRSRASEILSRRRALTVDAIRRISAAWRIPADLLVQPYTLRKRSAA